jgi:hypothetical protein
MNDVDVLFADFSWRTSVHNWYSDVVMIWLADTWKYILVVSFFWKTSFVLSFTELARRRWCRRPWRRSHRPDVAAELSPFLPGRSLWTRCNYNLAGSNMGGCNFDLNLSRFCSKMSKYLFILFLFWKTSANYICRYHTCSGYKHILQKQQNCNFKFSL